MQQTRYFPSTGLNSGKSVSREMPTCQLQLPEPARQGACTRFAFSPHFQAHISAQAQSLKPKSTWSCDVDTKMLIHIIPSEHSDFEVKMRHFELIRKSGRG
jgi:hypothetical protein